jgi:spoIIIJ-associated protein
VEWVETTGRTVEDAKEAALDELGVDESDAEFEVLEEARAGLFGRLRSEARVRARVRPTAPRAKEDRRDRRRRTRSGAEETGPEAYEGSTGSEPKRTDQPGTSGTAPGGPAGAPTASAIPEAGRIESEGATAEGSLTDDEQDGRTSRTRRRGGARRRSGPAQPDGTVGTDRDAGGRPETRDRGQADATAGSAAPGPIANDSREGSSVEVALDEQGQVAQDFLAQLVAEFGVDATIDVLRPDEDTVDLHLRGSDLGLLIGPRGSTLLAIQDLTRTIVHHRTGASNGRIHVDVGGYRQKRSEALARFAQQVAASVKQSGTRTVLEPMSAADRKVVHDTITPIDGVSTISEGEEPRRRVVVMPVSSPDQPG